MISSEKTISFHTYPLTRRQGRSSLVNTEIIPPTQLNKAIQALLRGELLVFPTDTVYGVAALATDAEAVARLFTAKARPLTLALPVMVATAELVPTIALPRPGFWPLARHFWPGALTMVLPRTELLPPLVTGSKDSVGVRIPNHPVALDLLRQLGQPLAVTSANVSGQQPASTAQEAWAQLGGRVSLIIDDGPAPGGQPSTVIDLTSSPAALLRPGPLSWEEILTVLGSEED